MQYPAEVSREGKFILARFPDCPGCQTFVEEGESIEEAAQEALEGWLESNLGRDLVPPQPSDRRIASGHRTLMIPIDPLLGVRLELRWARDDADLTQARLAQRVGMTQQQLAKLESGGNPTLSTLSRIARGLGRRVVVSLERESRRVVQKSKSSLVRERSPEYLARSIKKSAKRRRKR